MERNRGAIRDPARPAAACGGVWAGRAGAGAGTCAQGDRKTISRPKLKTFGHCKAVSFDTRSSARANTAKPDSSDCFSHF